MVTKVEVLADAEFQAWYRKAPKAAGTQAGPDGAKLFAEKGCSACHSIDGSPKVGPTLKGLLGRKETVTHGRMDHQVTIDEAFIRSKLLTPENSRIKGFPPIMPSQKGVLTDAEIDAIIRYIKTL